MLKVAGCILIFISCTGLGFLKASAYKARRVELENLLELIRLLNMEISYKKDSLQKTFQRISSLKPCWFAHVLEDCSNMLIQQLPLNRSWKDSIEKNMANCPLLPKDIEVIKDVSMGLGRSDTQGQKKIFEPAIVRIETNMKEAIEDEKKQGKMYRSLGIAAGIVIGIIII